MRWYLPLKSEKVDDKKAGGEIGGGMESGQDPDHAQHVKRPPMFGGGLMPLKPGGIAFGLVGHDFYHVGPGEYVDLPDSVPVWSIRNMAPQLLSKSEAFKAGLCHEDGTLKQQAAQQKPVRGQQPTQ